MPLVTTEAFVLRTYSLAEADKICVFFTRLSGKVRGVAHGARKLKSRFGSSLEPFTEVKLTYYQKENRELVHIGTCDLLRSHFNRAARDVETASAFSYMAELLGELLPEHESNERLYRLVCATLEAIEVVPEPAPAVRYFETWLLRLAGFYPDPSHCAGCGEAIPPAEPTFITAEGSPRCRGCSSGKGIRLEAEFRMILARMFNSHPTAFSESDVTSEELSKLREINDQIIRHVLERELRSRPVLGQL